MQQHVCHTTEEDSGKLLKDWVNLIAIQNIYCVQSYKYEIYASQPVLISIHHSFYQFTRHANKYVFKKLYNVYDISSNNSCVYVGQM